MLIMLKKRFKFFHRQLNEFNKQKQAFTKITTFIRNPLHASLEVTYRYAKLDILHSTGENSVLLAAINIFEQ
jgi:hypothetical protein